MPPQSRLASCLWWQYSLIKSLRKLVQQGRTLTASCYASTKFNHSGKGQFSQAMICLAISLRATLGPKNSIFYDKKYGIC